MPEKYFVQKASDVLVQYREVVKPLLAEVEALYEKFPIPIYNESRALVDHLSKCFDSSGNLLSQQDIDKQIEKCQHHIKRMILDCYKLLNINCKEVVERFERKTRTLDLRTIDNDGSFSSEYHKLSDAAIKEVREAKKIEALGNDNNTYAAYEKAHNTYAQLVLLIEQNRANIDRAKRKYIYNKFGWIIWSLITFIIGCVLTNNNEVFMRLFDSL